MKVKAETIINQLGLIAHPEGGYYKENYRSNGKIAPASLWKEAKEPRSYSTAIYFLLEKDQFSAFHRIKQDEIWHHYLGDTLLLHVIDENGNYKKIKIGNDLQNNETLQYVVPANCWFASEVLDKHSFVLCGCTVSPGFDFRDFEMPNREFLVNQFPQHEALITQLTHA